MKRYAKKQKRRPKDPMDLMNDPTAGFVLIVVTEHENSGESMIDTNWFGAAGPEASDKVRSATHMLGDLVNQTVAEVTSGIATDLDGPIH